MKDRQCWAACQTFTGKEHKIRSEIEKGNRGAFLPTFARLWVTDGKPSAKECALLPGYVLFRTNPDDWSDVAGIDGVARVLSNGLIASPVADNEMLRLMIGHASGAHNDIGPSIVTKRERRSSRRPRPSRRIRSKAVS